MCNFDWILNIKEQCENKNVSFIFSSTGTNFVKNNKKVFIPYNQTNIEAEKYNINYKSK